MDHQQDFELKQTILPKSKTWKQLLKEEFAPCISSAKFGLERETLRIAKSGKISKLGHPVALGSSLSHPLIKTDFAEPQVEYATGAFRSISETLRELTDLHSFTVRKWSKELLWPFSMPAILPDENRIPVGQYGTSKEGRKKTIYRKGLGFRYGRKMQTISGTHFNLSFDNCLLELVSEIRYKKPLNNNRRSQIYFDTIRNFNRLSPVLMYLFGASSVIDDSFLSRRTPDISKLKRISKKTLQAPYATSLRLSSIGYTSKVQSKLPIRFNSLEEYAESMCYAVSTPYPGYVPFSEKKENQLNDHYLQIENEYYSLIRPKQVPVGEERVLDALMSRGVEYLEVRLLDNDPFQNNGVEPSRLYFIHAFLLYCLLCESPEMTAQEKKEWAKNQETTSWNGRKKGFQFSLLGKKKELHTFIFDLLLELQPIVDLLDSSGSGFYTKAWEDQWEKWNDSSLLLSSSIELDLKLHGMDFVDYGIKLAESHRQTLLEHKLSVSRLNQLSNMSEASVFEQKKIENKEGSHLKKNRKPIQLKPLELCKES